MKNINFILLLALIVSLIGNYMSCQQMQHPIDRAEALEKALDAVRDTLKFNQEHQAWEISTIVSERDELKFLFSNSLDSIHKLQSLVYQHKRINKALLVEISTRSTDTVNTLEIKRDTFYAEGEIQSDPVYNTSWDREWTSGAIIASSEDIFFDIRFKNKFEIWQSDTLGVNTLYWRNLNPHTDVDEIFSWQLEEKTPFKPRRKKFVLSAGVGAGLGAKLSPAPFLGVTVGYKILEF